MKNKKWFTLIYIFLVLTLASILWILIVNKQSFFEKENENNFFSDILSKNILFNWDIYINNHLQANSSGWLYLPILSCPNNINYYSWISLIDTTNTSFVNNVCSWILNWQSLNISYSWNYTTFWTWIIWNSGFTLIWTNILTWTLTSPYSLSFQKPIIINDKFIKQRTNISWIISKNSWYNFIFWNNKEIRDFIDSNTNNTWWILKLSNISTWYLYLDISDWFSWKILELNRNIYETQKRILKLSEYTFSNTWWIIGYLQNNNSINSVITWNEKIFDFKNKDYILFLSYSSWSFNNIRYNVKVFNNDLSWVYINPIKDDTEKVEYLWNYLIYKDLNYYYKIYKLTDYK